MNLIYDLHDNPHIKTTCTHIAAEIIADPEGCDITHRLTAAAESLRWAAAWAKAYEKPPPAAKIKDNPNPRSAADQAPAADHSKQGYENEMPKWRNHPPGQPPPTAKLHHANGQTAVELEDGRFAATIDHPPQYWFAPATARRIATFYENRGCLPARRQALPPPPPPAPPTGENP